MNFETVKDFDVKRYMGRWYEIAKIPFVWEIGCAYATADYSWDEEEQVMNVKNTCLDENKNVKHVSLGVARIPNTSDPSKLKVMFEENPSQKQGDYFLNFTDYDHYAIVGSPTKEYVWILSRTPTIPKKDLPFLLNKVKYFGYNPDKIISINKFLY